MEALNHQQAALAEIVARAHAFFRVDWRELPIQPRWASLIVGPTGTGKTAVAAMAAEAVGASMLRVSLPSWMPLGAHNRGTKETIAVIGAHVARNDRTILVCDEIEKIFGGDRNLNGDGWRAYLANELFDLCDSRWPTGLKDCDGDEMTAADLDALTTKLRHSVFIVAIGTFQSWFDDKNTRRTMGFGAEIAPPTDELTADIVAEKMPRELANRFNGAIIRIPELRPEDYHRIAREAADKLPHRMQEAFKIEVERRIRGAIAAKKGVRFLEEAMMEVLKTLPPETANITAEFHDLGTTINNNEPCML